MAKKTRKPSTRQLEKKFAQTAFRLSQERSDFLLPQILDFVSKDKWINLHPEYQRRLVWDVRKKSLFIESVLNRLTVPAFYFAPNEADSQVSDVVDGQQRLTTLLTFFNNEFTLCKSDVCPYYGNSSHYAGKE